MCIKTIGLCRLKVHPRCDVICGEHMSKCGYKCGMLVTDRTAWDTCSKCGELSKEMIILSLLELPIDYVEFTHFKVKQRPIADEVDLVSGTLELRHEHEAGVCQILQEFRNARCDFLKTAQIAAAKLAEFVSTQPPREDGVQNRRRAKEPEQQLSEQDLDKHGLGKQDSGKQEAGEQEAGEEQAVKQEGGQQLKQEIADETGKCNTEEEDGREDMNETHEESAEREVIKSEESVDEKKVKEAWGKEDGHRSLEKGIGHEAVSCLYGRDAPPPFLSRESHELSLSQEPQEPSLPQESHQQSAVRSHPAEENSHGPKPPSGKETLPELQDKHSPAGEES